MYIVLFIFYSFLCCYGILRLPFFRKTGIKPPFLLLLFALHVGVGCIHNIIAWRYYPEHGDIWDSFRRSLETRTVLFTDPHIFISLNANWNYFFHHGAFWIQLLLDFFSFNNLYINTLLFSFPVFLGNAALFRFFRDQFPETPLAACCCFLLPSTLFWTSCVQRDGAIYMAIGLLLFFINNWLKNGYAPKKALACFLFFFLVAWFRPYVALFLLPALFYWIRGEWLSQRSRRLYAINIQSIIIILIVFLFGLTSPVLQMMTQRQKEFMDLEGHSRLYLPAMDGSLKGLLQVLPSALRNGFFEPLPGSGGQLIYWAFSVELLFIWLLCAGSFFKKLFSPSGITRSAPNSSPRPFIFSSLFFAFTGMFFIGLIVPFAGAIIRYRCLYLPFLLAPALYGLRHTRFFITLNNFILRNFF